LHETKKIWLSHQVFQAVQNSIQFILETLHYHTIIKRHHSTSIPSPHLRIWIYTSTNVVSYSSD